MLRESFWKRLALVFVTLTMLSTMMDIYSFFDRRALRALVDSRQKIGLVQIRASERAGLYTAEDKQRICEVWSAAQYDTTGEKCPE